MSTTEDLDVQIRSLITELMDGAPPAPSVTELDSVDVGRPARGHSREPQRSWSQPRKAVVASAVTAAAAGVALALVLALTGQPRQDAAAAQLRRIASRVAARQPRPQVGAGRYLMTQVDASLLLTASYIGSGAARNAQATVHATIQQWTDKYGDTCTTTSSSRAMFAGPVNQAAWSAAGLLDSPTDQPALNCNQATEPLFSETDVENGIVDVSRLTTNPTLLARELMTGNTGLAFLDQPDLGIGSNAAFERAAALLIGLPLTGVAPAFTSALYKALAMIPGVRSLGDLTTHSGTSGVGFAGESSIGRSVIIIDPSTGMLLEARNVALPVNTESVTFGFRSPAPNSPIAREGGSYGATVEWIDPIGAPSFVDSLPAGIVVPQPEAPLAGIEATARPQVTPLQAYGVERRLPQSGFLGAGTAPPAHAGGGIVFEFDFSSPSPISGWVAGLKASGLFSTIEVRYAHRG
jgi:hypothetical protein